MASAVRHLHRWLPGVPVVAFQYSVPYCHPTERAPANRPDAVMAMTSALARHAPRIARRARGDDLLLARALRSPLSHVPVGLDRLGWTRYIWDWLLAIDPFSLPFPQPSGHLRPPGRHCYEPLAECSWPVPGPPDALWQPLRGPSATGGRPGGFGDIVGDA